MNILHYFFNSEQSHVRGFEIIVKTSKSLIIVDEKMLNLYEQTSLKSKKILLLIFEIYSTDTCSFNNLFLFSN